MDKGRTNAGHGVGETPTGFYHSRQKETPGRSRRLFPNPLVLGLVYVHKDRATVDTLNRDVPAAPVRHQLNVMPNVGQKLLVHFLWVRKINRHC